MPISEAYQPNGFWDEMLAPGGTPRPGCERVAAALLAMPRAELAALRRRADEMLRRMGVTFGEQVFPFDPIPRVIDAETWATLERGLVQRVRALEAFVADVYGAGEILKDGVVPRDVVVGSPQFRHAAVGLAPTQRTFITVAGIDLVRGADGRFHVLEDNVRTPSGVSYALENRVVMGELLPELLRACGVRGVGSWPADLLAALRELAPARATEPAVALLTPGRHNAAYFEHTFLADRMGIPLVEGEDLVCRDHALFLRSGGRRVDVLYRRIDDDFLDPVVFRPDSLLGVAGLMAAIRAGNVALANMVGTGIADDKAVFAHTPAMIRYYLGEEPILPIVETHLLRHPDVRRTVLRDLDRWVVKPTGASGGHGVVVGPAATYRELADARDRIERDPGGFVAQPVVGLSVHPTLSTDAGPDPALVPRHVDLRPFVLSGPRPRVFAGGLTRVALRAGSLIVNSSQGGGSKDTWVLEGARP